MMQSIELWDIETGNVIADAADTAEAATILHELANSLGDDYVALVSVVRRDVDGSVEQLGSGADVLAATAQTAYRASAD